MIYIKLDIYELTTYYCWPSPHYHLHYVFNCNLDLIYENSKYVLLDVIVEINDKRRVPVYCTMLIGWYFTKVRW